MFNLTVQYELKADATYNALSLQTANDYFVAFDNITEDDVELSGIISTMLSNGDVVNRYFDLTLGNVLTIVVNYKSEEAANAFLQSALFLKWVNEVEMQFVRTVM